MKIGDRVFVHGYIDEIRKDIVIIRNNGGYFGTVPDEIVPSAQPEQRWIPCSERLPDCNGIYIVTRIMSDGFECRNIVDACYFDGSDTWHDDTRVNHGRKYLTDVVAWRELPEPYGGEQE